MRPRTRWPTPAASPVSQDQRNTISTRFRYQVVSRAWVAFGGAYGSGLPTEFDGTIQDAVQQFGQQIVDRVNFDRGRVRPSLALGASIGAELVKREHLLMRLQADVQNLQQSPEPHQFCRPLLRHRDWTAAQLQRPPGSRILAAVRTGPCQFPTSSHRSPPGRLAIPFATGQPKANDIKRKRNHKPWFRRQTCSTKNAGGPLSKILERDGRVLVTDMARKFDTSQVTIRKDLEVLHAHGLVHRTHGGALPAREGALEDPTLREKEKLHRKEKLRIAASAAAQVKEGQVVILDSGTTTTAIARALRNFHNITIITNALNIAAELTGAPVEVILTGGTLRKNSFSLVGPIAEETLRGLNADILFLGVDGFDVHYGLSTPNLLEAKVNRVMVEVAKRTVAVCDSSKFGRRSLSLIVPPDGLAGSHHRPRHSQV